MKEGRNNEEKEMDERESKRRGHFASVRWLEMAHRTSRDLTVNKTILFLEISLERQISLINCGENVKLN